MKTLNKELFHKLFHSEKSQTPPSRRRLIFSYLVLFLSPLAAFQCAEWFTHNPWTIMTWKIALWNALFYELVYWLLFFLTGYTLAACLIGDAFFFVFSLANYFVVKFRSAPIVPWDFFSIGTAASVMRDYSYEVSLQAGICIGIYIFLIILALFTRGRIRKRLSQAALVLILGIGLFGYVRVLHTDFFMKSMELSQTLFYPYLMSRKDGMTTAFLIDLKFLNVDKPAGYSAAEEAALLDQYPAATSDLPGDTEVSGLPNIIVIVDEAFSDLAVLGDFDTNMDYMPYMHSLQQGAENTITGWLNVSVKGGNTANTEYEFLTGHTMRFLPASSVPYQQHIFGEKSSLASWLKELGYASTAIHPFNSNGWNRVRVYPWFGFDTFLYDEHFSGASRVRKYIDDESCFNKILEQLEDKEEGQPLFVFAVTMQNHGGYSEDFENFTVDVTALNGESKTLDRYLSLMTLTDEALERLIRRLAEVDEDTILVFFGDHQPTDAVVQPVWELHGVTDTSLTEEELSRRFLVPYLIWANFDIEEKTGTETSVNYLAAHVLEQAGVPLSPFLQYQKTLEEKLPVIAVQKVTTADGHILSESDESVNETILAYQKMQYYRMFDMKQ